MFANKYVLKIFWFAKTCSRKVTKVASFRRRCHFELQMYKDRKLWADILGGFPDLPASTNTAGRFVFWEQIELHRQPAATRTPFIISKNKFLIYQIILSTKTRLFYHKSIIHHQLSISSTVVSTVTLETEMWTLLGWKKQISIQPTENTVDMWKWCAGFTFLCCSYRRKAFTKPFLPPAGSVCFKFLEMWI